MKTFTKRQRVRLIFFILTFLLIGVGIGFNRQLFKFRADEIQVVNPAISLPVNNFRYLYLNNPLVQGTATSEASLEIFDNNVSIATLSAGVDGKFYYKSDKFSEGNHTLKIKDRTRGTFSSTVIFSIDTSNPSTAILKSKNTEIYENDHPYYGNGVNYYEAIVKMMGDPAGVEADFAKMEKDGVRMVRVINYMLDDMALPNPTSAPTATVADGGGLTAGDYIYRYTCANLSKTVFAYNTAETLPSPISDTVTAGSNQKVTLTLTPCAESYRYLIYRRNAADPVNSETYLGFAEAPAGQNATFVDNGSYRPSGIWPDPTDAPILQTQARNISAKTTLEAGDYVYSYIYKEQKKPVDGRNDKFVAGDNGTYLTKGSPIAQVTVADGQAVNISIPAQNSPWAAIYRRKASDPAGSEKFIAMPRNANGVISYIDEGVATSTSGLPSTNSTAIQGLSITNETRNNPRTQWPTGQSTAFMTGFGNWNENALVASDKVMTLAKKYNIRIMFTFLDQHDNNTGGVREIARNCAVPNSTFFSDTCSKKMTTDIIDKFTNRVNTDTVAGIIYKNDPSLFAWELINEPYETNSGGGFRSWIWEIGSHLKSEDSNHMLSSGDDGSIWFTHDYESAYNSGSNHDFVMMGTPDPIDLLTWHGYPESSGFTFNHGYYGEFDPNDPSKRGGLDDGAAAAWLSKYGPVSGPISIDQTIKQLQLHSHYASLLNKPVVFGEWGVNWAGGAASNWISNISSAILTSKSDVERIQNIVPAASFSDPLTDFWNIDSNSATLSLDNGEKFNNNPSIKLGVSATGKIAVVSKKIPVKPNTSYWYEFTGKNSTAKSLEIKISAYYANDVRTAFGWGYGGNINQTAYNDGWRTITRFTNGFCEFTTPVNATEMEISATLLNGTAGEYAYIGDMKIYELGLKADSNTTTFSGTGWWAWGSDFQTVGNNNALVDAEVAFEKKSVENLAPLEGVGNTIGAPKASNQRAITYKNSFLLTGSIPQNASLILINGSADSVILKDGTVFEKEIVLPMGKSTITITAQDQAGNSADSSFDISRYKLADANNDGKVDIKDFSAMLASWNKSVTDSNQNADFNEDGKVDIKDFSSLLANWGK